jgi:hypothetical protein
MKKTIMVLISAMAASFAFATTLLPVQLLNPSGSTAGQLVTSNGPSSAPSWQSPVGAQVVKSNIPSGSAVSLTSLTNANMTSISLPAGDWQVCGNVRTSPGATTVTVQLNAGLSAVSSTFVNDSTTTLDPNNTAGIVTGAPVPCQQFNVTTTTTVYMVVEANFNTSTLAVYGNIIARRAQ